MSVKRTIFKGDSLEAIKGLSNDIAVFLYDAKELETYSITLNRILNQCKVITAMNGIGTISVPSQKTIQANMMTPRKQRF